MGQIVIYRDTPIDRERWVDVIVDGKRYRVDPEHSVSQAVGTPICREGCIISMAEGFMNAGHTVLMGRPNSRPYPFHPSHLPKLVYKLFGLAWVRGEWPMLERQLEYIRSEFRLRVLEHTAQCHIDKRWFDQIKLQVP
jgi:hypothetical protein